MQTQTPTPRTDKKKFISRGTASYPTLPKEVVLASDSETLERELIAMTEQLNEAWKEIDLLKTNLRIQTEHTENAVQDRADEHIELHNQIHELTEQRDEWKSKYIQQNKDLGCEQMDPDGTIWDYAKKVQTDLSTMTEQRDGLRDGIDYASNQLIKVTEQRDRLAEALRKAISWGDSASHHIPHRQNINWTYLNEAKETLQFISQPTEETK